VRSGHPWIFRSGTTRCQDVQAGDTVHVYNGPEALGSAVVDPDSPLFARMWSHSLVTVSDMLILERWREAQELRERFFGNLERTNAYRLLNGEGDRTPGLVLDRYDTCAVARTDGKAAQALFERVLPKLWTELQSCGVTTLVKDGAVLFGDPCERIAVREHSMPFWVDIVQGQKTGVFLDQRDNRLRVRELAQGKRVLNLFSYAGGFSQAAALGGASTVTSVDIAAKAHATARESFRLSGLDPSAHKFVTADAFEFLKSAAAKRETWDLVICDPPSFAPNEKSKDRALASYRRLHSACESVLAKGGVFCAASCSSHVTQEDFLQTLDARTLNHRNLKLVAAYGPPADHPTLAEFPEGRYLKFMVLS
jgi:23S rRNA (cytosine1962-C5)-methyltransferase